MADHAELREAAKGLVEAKAALQVAQTIMHEKGWWRNEAGYLTDAALWIARAADEIKRLQGAGEPHPDDAGGGE